MSRDWSFLGGMIRREPQSMERRGAGARRRGRRSRLWGGGARRFGSEDNSALAIGRPDPYMRGIASNEEAHMNADELRALQAPLKDRYRAEPGAARVTLRAEGSLDATS